MRKLLYFLLFQFFLLPSSYSQYEIMGSSEFGRIFGLTYDLTTANKLYAISMSNHILTSADNGQSWTIFHSLPNGYFNQVDNNLKNYGTTHLSFALRLKNAALGRTVHLLNINSNQIDQEYVAPNPNPGGDSWVSSYSIYPGNNDFVMISMGYPLGFGAGEKTYYTSDGGSNWNLIYDSTQNLDIIPGKVAIHPTNPQKLYITMGNGNTNVDGGLWISENGGADWTVKIEGIVLGPISFHPENPNEIYVGTGISFGEYPENLYKSTDGGTTWNVISIPWTDYLLDCINVIQFNPSNPQNILVLEDNEVAISNDGGATWNLTVYPDALDNPEDYSYGLDASFNPFNENEVFISANYYPMFSTNKGQSMARLKTPYSNSTGNINFLSKDGEEHLYYGVQYGFVHKDLNTEEESAFDILPINFVTNNSGTSLKIDPKNLGRIFSFSGGFMGYNLYISEDHGENAHPIYNTFSIQLDDVQTLPGENQKVWASFSAGGTNIEFLEIDFSDLDNIQTNFLPTPNLPGPLTRFLFPENNANLAFVAKGSRILKTETRGQSWTLMSNGLESLNLESDLIYQLTQNPLNPSQFSIASTKGIFTSTDSGENWTQKLPGINQNMKHSTVSENVMIAASHDSDFSEFKIKVSTNNGESWETLSDERFLHLHTTHTISSTDFHFYENFVDIYVGTSGLGVVRFTLDLNTLSIIDSDIPTKNSVILFPNPTKDTFTISTEKNIQKIDIYAMSGQRLISHSSTSKTLNVSHLNPGVYIVKILFENGETVSEKLIRK
jgi:xyloglucan-specific exo-beta-1,4-glucanase